MKISKLTKNKIGKGIVSLIAIVILLSSILATSIFYSNNITTNAVREVSVIVKLGWLDEGVK